MIYSIHIHKKPDEILEAGECTDSDADIRTYMQKAQKLSNDIGVKVVICFKAESRKQKAGFLVSPTRQACLISKSAKT